MVAILYVLKTIEPYTLNGWIIWNVNYISIKTLLKLIAMGVQMNMIGYEVIVFESEKYMEVHYVVLSTSASVVYFP